jgi:hypothetical protein
LPRAKFKVDLSKIFFKESIMPGRAPGVGAAYKPETPAQKAARLAAIVKDPTKAEDATFDACVGYLATLFVSGDFAKAKQAYGESLEIKKNRAFAQLKELCKSNAVDMEMQEMKKDSPSTPSPAPG